MTDKSTSQQISQEEKSNKQRRFRNTMIIVISLLLLLACVLFFLFDPRDYVPGQGTTWSLGNFTLMNVCVFECFMLLIGGYVTTTRKERRPEEEASINVRWLPRILSVPVMIIALIVFVLVENVDLLPLVYFDQWTWIFVILVIVQSVLVALSKKRYNEVDPQDQSALK